MKYCKKCWKLNENPLLKYCMEHTEFNKSLKKTKIKTISKKKIQRIKETWGEKNTFKQVFKNSDKRCVICKKYILEPKIWCFAHILSKKDYPHLRNFTNNIALVCSIECHWEVDSRISWKNKKEIETEILNWKEIIFSPIATVD